MIDNANEEYITYERFHTLNKQCTSESCVADASGSNLFYDLDGVVKRNSYSCCTEDVALSTVNIFRALNTKGDEWPKAPSQANPVHIVQECTTSIKPHLNRCDKVEKYLKKERSTFLRECILSSGICLKDNIEESDSSSNLNCPSEKDKSAISKVDNYVSYQTEQIIIEGHDKNKTIREKRIKNLHPCEYDNLGCACQEDDKGFKTESSKFVSKPRTASSYKDEVVSNMSNNHRTHLEMEDKLTRMSGDGLTETHSLYIPKKDTSCILILGKSHLPKICHSQVSSFRKSGVRLMRVLTKRNRAKPKKVRAVKCPNCREHIEFTVSTEDEASLGVPPKKDGKSETVFNCTVSSKEKNHPKIVIPKECPHGCEMVPICQLPKVNMNDSNTMRSLSKKTMPQFIKMTKPCRHYPPCSVVPTCQRSNVMKVNCESISPCFHRPRCLNLPLCIPFCKNLQYDESAKQYVDVDEQLKYIPVSPLQTYSQEPRAYLVNQTHLSCQVPSLNAKQYDIANKSCQYNYLKDESNNAVKEDTRDTSVIYIRDVGCQFKNSSFKPHTSYFQTRVCYTSSASFDPGSKRLDNIYTNPKAFTCERLIIKSNMNLKLPSTSQSVSSGVEPLSSQHDSTHKPVSKAHAESGSNTVAFCMLRNGECGYLVPEKPKRNALKDKCKNKFTISRRQISKISNSWFRKNV